MMRRTIAISKKEFKHLLRDKRMLFVLFFFPALLLAVYGYAVNFDVQNIKLGVYDIENSKTSRDFIGSISSSSYFEIVENLSDYKLINKFLDEKKVQAVLIIPSDFSESIYAGRENAKVQFLVDGVDGNTATIVQNYVNAAAINYNQKVQYEMLQRKGAKNYIPLELHPIFWFNPDLQTTKFLLPGLIGLILIITIVVTVSLSLVREKEKGTIEQLNISSIKNIEMLLGKSFPYLIIAFINSIFILAVGYILFDFVNKGSYILLALSILIFLFACTGMGIFISTLADSLQVAFSAATFVAMLPSVILTGFIFPIESMPFVIQIITNLSPTKFFIVNMRALTLRGAGLEVFWLEWLYLFLFGAIFLILSAVVQKRKSQNV